MYNTVNNNFRMGLRDGMPIGIGYFTISFAFGLMAAKLGLSILEAVAISVFNLTSAGQMAALPIIASAGSLVELLLTQFVINVRYSLMSISLSPRLDKSIRTRDRFILAFSITDEMFAVAIGQNRPLGKKYLYSLMILPIIGWSLGTLCGAIAGNILPSILVTALSVSMYAMFIAIIIPPAKKSPALIGAILTSVAISCLLEYTPVLTRIPDGFAIIICAIVAAIIISLVAPIKDEEEVGENE